MLKKVINDEGRRVITEFIKENLSGNVSDQTIDSYVGMAQAKMDMQNQLPEIEISMCFSLTGENESLELMPEEVTYEDAVFDDLVSLEASFKQTLNPLQLEQLQQNKLLLIYDGYLFKISSQTGDKKAPFLASCLGLNTAK